MFKWIKEAIKKNDKLYVIARCIKNINNPEYVQLVKGFYERYYYDASSILVHHYGQEEPDKLVFVIHNDDCSYGFCALLVNALSFLNCADIANAIPTILWSKHTLYYDIELENKTHNVFEYYFDPVSDIPYDTINSYKNVSIFSDFHSFCRDKRYENDGWFYDGHMLQRYAMLYKKYIRLNDSTSLYISSQIGNMFSENDRVIGVHVRGTDYGVGYKNHPLKIQPLEYLNNVREIFSSGNYNKIFLATDDLNALEIFKKEFPDNLVYYSDAFRSDSDVGPHSLPSDRPLHHYKLGLEVLRDVYTLANCDAIVCGVSNVSLSSRYINLALDKRFNEVVVLNHGINKTDSKKARNLKAESRKNKAQKAKLS